MPLNYHTLPGGDKAVTFKDHAEALLSKFPKADRATILLEMTASYMMDLRYGNKREERAACDFLNLLQKEAIDAEGSKS